MRRNNISSYDVWIDAEDESMSMYIRLFFDANPGEPAVMYDRDGSGYPGSPATIDITGVSVLRVERNGVETRRSEDPAAFAVLDVEANKIVGSDEETYIDLIADHLSEDDREFDEG